MTIGGSFFSRASCTYLDRFSFQRHADNKKNSENQDDLLNYGLMYKYTII